MNAFHIAVICEIELVSIEKYFFFFLLSHTYTAWPTWPNPDLICKRVFFNVGTVKLYWCYLYWCYLYCVCLCLDSWSSPVRSAVYLLGQNVNVQISTRHHYPGVKLFINSCYVATVNTLSPATKYSIIDNYGWVKQNANFVGHLTDTKHSHTYIQVFTGKPDKSRCFKIQIIQGRQCCSVLFWCFPIHWGSRCPGVFIRFFSHRWHILKTKQCCSVHCDVFIVCFLIFSVHFPYRSHSIVKSLCLVEALVQCRSHVFTGTQTKG